MRRRFIKCVQPIKSEGDSSKSFPSAGLPFKTAESERLSSDHWVAPDLNIKRQTGAYMLVLKWDTNYNLKHHIKILQIEALNSTGVIIKMCDITKTVCVSLRYTIHQLTHYIICFITVVQLLYSNAFLHEAKLSTVFF